MKEGQKAKFKYCLDMARLVKIFQALKRHKKKTIFFSAVLAGGLNYANEKYE